MSWLKTIFGEDAFYNTLYKLAENYGAGDIALKLINVFHKTKEVKPHELQQLISEMTVNAKAKGSAYVSRLNDQLLKLQTMPSSPATKAAIGKAISNVRSKISDASKKMSLAESYENANSGIVSEVSMLNRYERGSERAHELADKAEENAAKAAELYNQVEKEIK